MISPESGPVSAPDPFHLHYRQGKRRCVTSYDTIEAALESARRKLARRPEMELWISGAGKEVVLDGTAIRERLAQAGTEGPPPASP